MTCTMFSPATPFLSTPSVRRATGAETLVAASVLLFLPTPSARRATREKMDLDMQVAFLSTPSVKRATDGFY